jgi:hypothetical protein
MTDITISTPAVLRSAVPAKSDQAPRHVGINFERLFTAIGDAFRLAYVIPYASTRRPLPSEAHSDGRDPRW